MVEGLQMKYSNIPGHNRSGYSMTSSIMASDAGYEETRLLFLFEL